MSKSSFKNLFFSRLNITLIVACISVVYATVWVGAFIESRIDRNRIQQVIKAEEERLKNLSPEEKSVLKAQNHLVDSVTLIEPSERIILTYLQRKFDLPAILGTNGPPIYIYEDPITYPDQVHYLLRIAYPDRIFRDPPKYELDNDIKVTNIYSANCDHIPLPGSFWSTMEKGIQAGDYYLTHVALALQLMKDNGCTLPPGTGDMNNRVAQDMARLADNVSTSADLRYEAVAFLFLIDRQDLVKPAWIDQIIKEQRDDGSWSKEVGGKKNDHHSTLLAFWSLLEYARPNTPDEPLIRQPTPAP